MDQPLTLPEAAQLVGRTARTLRRAATSGRLRTFEDAAGRRRVTIEALREAFPDDGPDTTGQRPDADGGGPDAVRTRPDMGPDTAERALAILSERHKGEVVALRQDLADARRRERALLR